MRKHIVIIVVALFILSGAYFGWTFIRDSNVHPIQYIEKSFKMTAQKAPAPEPLFDRLLKRFDQFGSLIVMGLAIGKGIKEFSTAKKKKRQAHTKT